MPSVNREIVLWEEGIRYLANVDIVYEIDNTYGQDADGNRNTSEIIIKNVLIRSIFDEKNNCISVTNKLQDRINTLSSEYISICL